MTRHEWVARVAHATTPPALPPAAIRDRETFAILIDEAMVAIRQDQTRTKKLAQAAQKLARHIARVEQSPHATGEAARLIAHTHLLAGRARTALRHYEAAWQAFETARNPSEQANTAVAMVQALAYTGDYPRAFDIARFAIQVFDLHQDEFRAARMRANLANTLHRLDRLPEARELYEQALPVLTAHKAEADLAIVMRNYGVCLMGLLEFDAADKMYAQARETFLAAENTLLVLEIDLNRAYLLGRQGLVREALQTYRRLRDALPPDSGFEIGHCLLDQADFMAEYGLWSDADSAAQEAAAIFARLGARFEHGKARLVQAIALLRKGDLPNAKARLDEANPLIRKEPNENWKALHHRSTAEYFRRKGQTQKALQRLRAAQAFQTNKDRARIAHIQLVDLLIETGKTQEARSLLENKPEPFLTAKLHRIAGDPTLAEAAARQALRHYDQDRRLLGSLGLRRAVAAAQEALLRESFRALRQPDERLAAVTRVKDQSLAEAVNSPEGIPKSDRLRELRTRLLSAPDLARPEAEADLLAQYAELQTLAPDNPQLQPDHSLAAQTADPPGLRFIEFFADQGHMRAFVVQSHDSNPARPVTEHDLGPLENIEEIAHYFHLNRLRFSEHGQRLTQKALARLADILAPVINPIPKTIVVGRDGPLATLPVHAIPHPQRPDTPLVESIPVLYAPSFAVWQALSQRPQAKAGHKSNLLAGHADHLAPEIAAEIQALAPLLNTKPLASLAEIARAAPTAHTVHLAAHGLLREDRPLFSSLLLGEEELSVFDVLQLKLTAQVTVLSGCSTGVSLDGNALDKQGFIEALLAAGSQTVVATLWDAADTPSKDWMLAFHTHLAQTPDPARAYQEACRISRQAWPHPGHWAPFALFGRPANSTVG